MKITKRQLRRIIREEYTRLQQKDLIREAMAQQDILYLGNLLKAYPGTFRDWPEFCDWYDEFVMDLRVSEDEFMDDFLYTFDLMDCPGSLTELLSVINDPGAQSHPKFSAWANALRSNF